MVKVRGEAIKIKNVSQQIQHGFALVPEDRQREGLVQTMNIAKNISLSSLKNYAKAIFLNEKKEAEKVEQEIKDIHIKVADKNLPILSLSGGNQQKVVIGKGLLTDPQILLLDEPSRGIDIGAKACVGSYVVIEGDTTLGDHAHLEGQSALIAGEHLPAAARA